MKIFLIGWFGAGNIGDEAILLSELHFLREQIQDVEFYILSFNPERTQSLTADIPQVKKVLRMGSKRDVVRSELVEILKTFRKVDVVIIGGGGLFQDIYNHYPTPFFTAMAILARLHRKRLILYCLGIGPLSTFIAKKFCKFAANLAEMISVRDPESKELLKKLGVTREVCLSADPVFLLEPVWNEKVERIMNTLNLSQSQPIIAVCPHDLLPWDENSRGILANILDSMVRERAAQIVFLPLGIYKNRWIHTETSDTVDIAASKRLAALMNEKSCMITEELSPQEFLAALQHVDLVISMRFHGLVMGLTANVPVIALTFRQEAKLHNMMKRVRQNESLFEVGNLEQKAFLERIEYILSHHETIKIQLVQLVSSLKEEAEKCNKVLGKTLMNIPNCK